MAGILDRIPADLGSSRERVAVAERRCGFEIGNELSLRFGERPLCFFEELDFALPL